MCWLVFAIYLVLWTFIDTFAPDKQNDGWASLALFPLCVVGLPLRGEMSSAD
jgi:hypothetical protein